MISLIVFTLIAAVLFLIPVMRKQKNTANNTVQLAENKALYLERKAEIESNDAGLSDEIQQALLTELNREFLAAADNTSQIQESQNPLVKIMAVAAITLICVFSSVALYQYWGASNEIRVVDLLETMQQRPLDQNEREELLTRIDAAGEKHDERLEWKFYNGRLLTSAGDYAKASLVFSEILQKLPEESTQDRASTMTLLAQAKFYEANQVAEEDTYQILKDSLDLVEDQPQAWGLAGIMAFELAEYEEAVQHWRNLWLGMPQSPEADSLAEGIRKAAEKAAQNGNTIDVSWLIPASVTLTVDISEEAKSQLSKDTPVFVIAKATDGTPIPVAVNRTLVSALPVTITLTDADAMAPGLRLSAFDNVRVQARASVSGAPMANSGDWEATAKVVTTRNQQAHNLVIDRLL